MNLVCNPDNRSRRIFGDPVPDVLFAERGYTRCVYLNRSIRGTEGEGAAPDCGKWGTC